jgi:hypothetical protein
MGLHAFCLMRPLQALGTEPPSPSIRLFRLSWPAQLMQCAPQLAHSSTRLSPLTCPRQPLALVECDTRLPMPRHLGRWSKCSTHLVPQLTGRRIWEHHSTHSLLSRQVLPTLGTRHPVKILVMNTVRPRISYLACLRPLTIPWRPPRLMH